MLIILKKDNHYEHTSSVEIAQAKVNEGYEVIKGPRLSKQAKKASSKKKK